MSSYQSPSLPASASVSAGDLSLLVHERELASEGVVTLVLRDAEGERLPDWTPGSHITLRLGPGLERQYSLCGERRDAYTYRIAVQHEPHGRGGSDALFRTLHPGSRVVTSRPRNNFRLTPAEEYLFIAGGIGITPIVPMMEAAEALGTPWRLLYLGKSLDRLAFVDRLPGRGAGVSIRLSSETGRCDLAAELGSPRRGRKVFACGPRSLLDALSDLTGAWPVGLYRAEHFSAGEIEPPARTTPFSIQLGEGGPSWSVAPDESVIDVLGRAGCSILTSCREGVCGTCEVGVLDGKPDHRDTILDESEREGAGCFFPCVSRSLSDRLVLDL